MMNIIEDKIINIEEEIKERGAEEEESFVFIDDCLVQKRINSTNLNSNTNPANGCIFDL